MAFFLYMPRVPIRFLKAFYGSAGSGAVVHGLVDNSVDNGVDKPGTDGWKNGGQSVHGVWVSAAGNGGKAPLR